MVLLFCGRAGEASPEKTVERRRSADQETTAWGEVCGDVGFGVLGGDVFTTFQLGVDIQEGDINVGLQAALRIRTVDLGEQQSSSIRRRDWDEPSDFAHIVRYLSYRKEVGNLKLGASLGELAPAELGNGTILGNYYSVVDIDHPHSGFRARAAHRYFQVDLVLDDFVAPEILGGRIVGRPVPGLPGLSVGVSGVVDLKAPSSVRLDEEGNRQLGEARSLVVDSDPVGVVGVEVGYDYGDRGDDFWLRGYADNNWLVGHGGGLHLGVKLGGRPFGGPVSLAATAEYRLSWDGYQPTYVDLYYDIQRFQASLDERAIQGAGSHTKLQAIQTLRGVGHGGKWAVGLWYERLVWARAGYELRDGPLGDQTFFELGVPYGRKWVFSALLAKTGLVEKGDWQSEAGLLSAGELRVRLLRHLYLLGQVRYLYGLDDEGYYRGILVANAAVGGSFGY
jgi:hypothetical protein